MLTITTLILSSNNKKSQVDEFQSLLTNLINKHNII